MRKTTFLITLFFFLSVKLLAQRDIEVPSQIRFADMRLNLTPEARKKIQTDVDALVRHEKYFNAKVEKVDAHLPLIEQVLREENVPDDIKYLVIQESALVGDAVSTSDAVGYWQFKEPTGREVGLTINNEVDERMNIITATRGAARYFKNNNTFFDNWLYALLAYYAGPGGALKIADKKYYGKREMKLDGQTHWYVIKYLAHKIAFEQAVGQNPRPEMVLFAYTEGNGKTLEQVASEFNLQETDLEPYNKWVRKRRIPDDKQYFVIIPDYSGRVEQPLLAQKPTPSQTTRRPEPVDRSSGEETDRYAEVDDTGRFPVVQNATRWGKKVTLINGIPGVIAQNNDNIRTISQRTDVVPSRIVRFNDLTSKQSDIVSGKPYYLKRKRNRGPVHYHVVEPGETLWSISQRFGIKLKKLMRNNRMLEEEALKPGRVLWLRFIRPPHIPVEYRDVPSRKEGKQETIARMSASVSDKATNLPVEKEERIPPERPSQAKNTPSDAKPSSKATTNPVTKDEEKTQENILVARKETLQGHEEHPEQERPAPASDERPTENEQELVPVISQERERATDANRYHTVQAGETLYSIARQYDLTIPQLTSYNDIDWEIPLSVGQKLRLSPPEEKNANPMLSESKGDSFLFHEVTSGETMYRIARQYDVTIKELMEWNDKEDFSVSVGERLKIRQK